MNGDEDYDDVVNTALAPSLNRAVRGAEKLKGVRPELVEHWNKLDQEFKRAGIVPEIKSGYRTAEQQNALYRNPATRAKTKGNDGYNQISPHQRGDALDVSFAANQRALGRRILAQYAQQNGLHIPSDEPWHISYTSQKPQTDSYADVVDAAIPKQTEPSSDDYDDVVQAAIGQQPKTPQVTSSIKELDSQQEIPAGALPPVAAKPIAFQPAGRTAPRTLNPVETLYEATDEKEIAPKGLARLQSREYQPPASREVGERVKLQFPHGAPTEDDVVNAYLSTLGPEYAQLGERYKAETGHNILTVAGNVKQEDDGSFSIRPSRGAVDFINAYAKGGLNEALPLAERQRRDYIKAQEDARLRAQPTVERARRAVEAEKQSPVSRGILTSGAGPMQAGGTLLGPAGSGVRDFADELRAVGEQAESEKPLKSLSKTELAEYGAGALIPTAATLALTRQLGPAQLPALGVLQGQTPAERIKGGLEGTAMQAALGPIPSQLGESLPSVARKGVAGPTLAAIPTAQAIHGGEPVTSALIQNAPFALMPMLEKGGGPERPTELGIQRAETAGVPGEATANIDQRLAERESRVQPTFLRDDQGKPVARVLNPDEVAEGGKPKVRAIHHSDTEARDESGKFTVSTTPPTEIAPPSEVAQPATSEPLQVPRESSVGAVSEATPQPTEGVPVPRPALPKIGDTVEAKVGIYDKPVRGEVVRLQDDPTTGQQVPIIKTPSGKEIPLAEWHESGRVVSGVPVPEAKPSALESEAGAPVERAPTEVRHVDLQPRRQRGEGKGQFKKESKAQAEGRRAQVSPAPEESPAIQQAFADWTDRRAYIDGNGNYHVKREGRPSGPIAPWNKEVKAKFANVTEFHNAANKPASEPTERITTPLSEPLREPSSVLPTEAAQPVRAETTAAEVAQGDYPFAILSATNPFEATVNIRNAAGKIERRSVSADSEAELESILREQYGLERDAKRQGIFESTKAKSAASTAPRDSTTDLQWARRTAQAFGGDVTPEGNGYHVKLPGFNAVLPDIDAAVRYVKESATTLEMTGAVKPDYSKVTPVESAKPPEQIPESTQTELPKTPEQTVAPEPSTTSARKAQLAADRAELELPELPAPERKGWRTSLINAKEKGLDQKAERLADQVLRNPRALDDEQTAGMTLRLQQLKNEHSTLLKEIGDGDFSGEKRAELEAVENSFDKISEAVKKSGTEKGRALASQKLTINQDYDLISMLNRYKAKVGKEPSPEIRAEIEGYQKRIAELEKEAADREIQPTVQKMQREARRERRQVTKKVLDEEAATIKQNIAAEFQRLKSQQSNIQSTWGLGNLDPEGVITREALKYVRNRVEAGVTDTAQLVDDVHSVLSEFVDGVTKRQVAEMISGYGRPSQQTRSELQKQIDSLKTQMRAELKQADVEAGTITAKRQGPPETKRAIERRFNKQIDELNRRIRESDFTPKAKRGPTVLDADTQKLADRLAKTKSEYELFLERSKPWSWVHTISSIRKSGMLSGFLTHVRNIAGTAGYQGFEEVRRVPSVVMDAALSSFTGRRTTTLSPSAMLDGVIQSLTAGRAEAKDILKHGAPKEQLERQQLREINTGVKAIDLALNSVFRVMSASDRIFYQGSYKRNLVERAQAQTKTEARNDKSVDVKARAKELIDNPSIQLDADAKHDALVSTFNNNNRLSDAIKAGRGRMGAGGNFALDIVLPFDRTPTNVIARVLEASPAGYVKNAGQAAKAIWNRSFTAAEQRAFVQTFGRATTGTAIMALGFAMAAKGLLETDDYGTVRLKVGKRKVNLSAVAPIGTMLGVGAALQKEHSKDDPSTWGYMKAVAKPVGDIPILQSTSQVADVLKDPERNVPRTAARTAFSFTPFSGAVKTVAETIDPAENRYPDRSFKQQYQVNIPKWRESLPTERKGEFKTRLLEGMRQGERPDLDALVDSERITPSEKAQIEHNLELTPSQVRFDNAPNDKALDRYERMSEAQRAELRDIMERKAWTLTHSDTLTESQKEGFRNRLEALGIEGRDPRKKTSGLTIPSFRTRFAQGAP